MLFHSSESFRFLFANFVLVHTPDTPQETSVEVYACVGSTSQNSQVEPSREFSVRVSGLCATYNTPTRPSRLVYTFVSSL